MTNMTEYANSYSDFGITYNGSEKVSPKGEVDLMCPVCEPFREKHHGEHKLRLNPSKGAWHCAHCGWKGGLTPKDWVKDKPIVNRTGVRDAGEKIQEYWKKRGISPMVLSVCNVKEKNQLIRDKNTGNMVTRLCTAFVYTQNGWPMMIKFRDGYKNFSIEKGGKLIPWGLDWIRHEKTCIIVEGEPDRLSFFQAGLSNVVSVPNGTTISKEEKEHFEKTGEFITTNVLNLSYFDNCYEHFESKDIIYIATDADPAGIKLRHEIARRFGADKCKFIDFSKYEYPDKDGNIKKCKDANDVLMNIGEPALKKTLDHAENFPIDDVITIDDVWDKILYQFENGLDYGKPTGIDSLNAHFLWKMGHTVTLNGHANMGKTTFAMNLILLTCILYDWKWGIYSPENYPVEELLIVLMEIYIGKTLDKKEKMTRANSAEIDDARNFIREHIELINNEEGYTPELLRKLKKQMILRRGIHGFFTDPWNALIQDNSINQDAFLTKELSAEVRFAVNNMVINFIGVHPPTPSQIERKDPTLPSEMEVSGGAVWSKKVYDMISIHYDKNRITDQGGPETDVAIVKTKSHRLVGIPTGRLNPVKLRFRRSCNRFILSNNIDPFDNAKKKTNQSTITWDNF